jgi:hypothetical protein
MDRMLLLVLEEKRNYEFVNVIVSAKKTRIEWRMMC